eukprot:SAG22_NODE_1894_length_3366_cov_4.054178_1_plen_462_part_00
MHGRGAAQQRVIIQRIRACHHISLAAENRSKLQKFFALLWKLIGETVRKMQDRQHALQLVDAFSSHIVDMAASMPEFAGALAMKYLQAIANGHRQTREDGAHGWPPIESLFYLQLCAVIFPPSDFVHPVLTPAALLVSQLLAQCEVKCASDVIRGLFLCAWSVRLNKELKRLQPEPLAFCTALIEHYGRSRKRDETVEKSFSSQMKTEMNENVGLGVGNGLATAGVRALFKLDGDDQLTGASTALLSLSALWHVDGGGRGGAGSSPSGAQAIKAQCIGQAYRLLRQMTEQQSANSGCPEVFEPLITVLQSRDASAVPPCFREQHEALQLQCTKAAGFCSETRRPLAYLKRRPVPMKQLNPKFEDDRDARRRGELKPIDEKEERRKLQRQHKKEMRGAAKELRKDSETLARKRLADWKSMRARDEGKKNEIVSFIQGQAAEYSGKVAKKPKDEQPVTKRQRV